MVAINFTPAAVQARYGSDGGGLPAGKHKVIIENTEMVPTKDSAQTGNAYLKLRLKCIEGLAVNGIQEDRLNLHNSSQQTVAIAQGQLAAYGLVCGKPNFQDTVELHNIPFYVETRQQRNNPEYTEVARLFDMQGNEPGKGQQPQAAQQPPQGFGPGPTPPQQQWAPPAAAAPAPQQQFAPQPEPQQQWGQPQAQPAAAPWSPGASGAAPSWGQR
jgi:hypothetical protein